MITYNKMNHFTVLLFRTRAWYLKILWSFFTGKWQLRCGLWYYWSWRQIHQLRNILHEEISKYKHFLSPRADWLFRDSTSGATILTHYQANVFLPTFSQKYLSYMPMGAKLGSAHAPVIFLPRSEIIHLWAQLFLSRNYINTFI